ncbi:MAG: hypothetical protein KKA65_03730, partial [Nanoarchaeota archaeon]|nr:hypothetical protein [Nanoarchaeota archaeon]MCG2720131.1 hypothetical protein [Nanoarchaeota archaeon]
DTKQGIIGIYWDIKDEGFKRSTMLHFEKVKTNDPEKNQQLIDEEEPARFVLGTTPAEQTPVIKNLPFGLEGRINIENFDSPERELTLNLRLRNIERVTERENECTIKSSMVLKQSESCYIQKDGNLIEVHWEVEQVDGVPNAVLYLE